MVSTSVGFSWDANAGPESLEVNLSRGLLIRTLSELRISRSSARSSSQDLLWAQQVRPGNRTTCIGDGWNCYASIPTELNYRTPVARSLRDRCDTQRNDAGEVPSVEDQEGIRLQSTQCTENIRETTPRDMGYLNDRTRPISNTR